MSAKDKWIRRFSVDETAKHKNGFTIYKITSILFPLESPESVTSVSVWKRYSDVQRLHKSMRSLHTGLHLRGTFPNLPRYSYFKRFQKEVIEERAKTIKSLLEFVAEHRLLFTSTEFVNFLQTGYPEPERPSGVINTIRSSLHLPIEDTPPLEYQTDDDDSRSPVHSARQDNPQSRDETDFISQIPIYEAADVEIRSSPKKLSKTNSFESITSIESLDSDVYEELNKLKVEQKSCIRKMLPDLIIFDAPSTSTFEYYHDLSTGNTDDNVSLSNLNLESNERRSSKLSLYSKRSVLSLSNVDCKTKTEDSYVFEAGYMLNLAARCEDIGDYHRAFEYYKSGIEKMLIGVQTDTDPQRRALIKEKTNKYLSYAEDIYKKHLSDGQRSVSAVLDASAAAQGPVPLSMLVRPYEHLAQYRVLALLGSSIMLVMHNNHNCYAMKVIQKIPNNLTEFDEHFLQRTPETRTPKLPTMVPYMVPLQGYVETNNLIFLILSYAPGEKLFDYIKRYAKSMPNTPKREVNLENVFAEPKKNIDSENNMRLCNDGAKSIIDNGRSVTDNGRSLIDNGRSVTDNGKSVTNNGRSVTDNGKSVINNGRSVIDNGKSVTDNGKSVTDNVINMNVDSVDVLLLNSQKLLRDVDKVLTEFVVVDEKINKDEGVKSEIVTKVESCSPRGALPRAAVCVWAAQVLVAVECLHNIGIVCRDLNPSNILLGKQGQVILTYFYYYHGVDMTLSKLREKSGYNIYIAPELYLNTIYGDDLIDKVCDFWSYGVVLYELICGVSLSEYHRSMFTSHTILQLPDGLNVDEESLLTQLLTFDPTERLGGGKDGINEIKSHPYFKNIDWFEIYNNWIVPD